MRPNLKQYQTAIKLVYSNSFFRYGISKGQLGWHRWYGDLLQSGQSKVELRWRQDFLCRPDWPPRPTQPPVQWVLGFSWV